MAKHSNVAGIDDITTEEYFLFRVRRDRPRDSLVVWLSDAYRFGDMDYHNRPQDLAPGDFILVARPEAGFRVANDLIEQNQIGVGQIGKFMGALNSRRSWQYLTAEEREQRLRGR